MNSCIQGAEASVAFATHEMKTCRHCDAILLSDHRSIYCDPNCRRKSVYHRKSPEERAEINRRSNRRRYSQDILPHIQSICDFRDEFPEKHHGGPWCQYIVGALLIQAMASWKLELALGYSQVRDALADLCGGFEALEELEERVGRLALEAMEKAEDPQ